MFTRGIVREIDVQIDETAPNRLTARAVTREPSRESDRVTSGRGRRHILGPDHRGDRGEDTAQIITPIAMFCKLWFTASSLRFAAFDRGAQLPIRQCPGMACRRAPGATASDIRPVCCAGSFCRKTGLREAMAIIISRPRRIDREAGAPFLASAKLSGLWARSAAQRGRPVAPDALRSRRLYVADIELADLGGRSDFDRHERLPGLPRDPTSSSG